jgi:capsular polysaccharide biosynthesis protein
MNKKIDQTNFSIDDSDEINIIELFYVLWKKKLLILTVTLIFAISSVLYSINLPNIYKSEALLAPQNQESAMSGGLSQYAGVASLAGISIPTESGNKTTEAISRIKSFSFFSSYILPKIALEDLMAALEWDHVDNTIKYDNKLFDSKTQKWVRDFSYPYSQIPSDQEAYKAYRSIVVISEDKKTSFVSVSVKHLSPIIARDWTNIIINELNRSMRYEDREETNRSINFLNNLALEVNYEELRKVASSLLQEQMKNLMLIDANKEYIFKVLDAPYAPEEKFEPKRSVIVILATFFGFIISVIYFLALSYIKKP